MGRINIAAISFFMILLCMYEYINSDIRTLIIMVYPRVVQTLKQKLEVIIFIMLGPDKMS